MTRLTPAREREIDELRAGITPGPFEIRDEERDQKTIRKIDGKTVHPIVAEIFDWKARGIDAKANAAFWGAAPQIVDEQKAEIEALRADVERHSKFECKACGVKEISEKRLIEELSQSGVIAAKEAEIEVLRAEIERMKNG